MKVCNEILVKCDREAGIKCGRGGGKHGCDRETHMRWSRGVNEVLVRCVIRCS